LDNKYKDDKNISFSFSLFLENKRFDKNREKEITNIK